MHPEIQRDRCASNGHMVRDARRCRAPHHEGFRPYPESLTENAANGMGFLTKLVMPGTRVRLRRPEHMPLCRASTSWVCAQARKTWMAGTSSAKTRFALLPGHDGKWNHVQAVRKSLKMLADGAGPLFVQGACETISRCRRGHFYHPAKCYYAIRPWEFPRPECTLKTPSTQGGETCLCSSRMHRIPIPA